MKRKIVAVGLITLAGFLFAEEGFWKLCLEGHYEAAADSAASLGAKAPEYYALAAVCYQNAGEYYKESLMQYFYSEASGDRTKLVALLDSVIQTGPQNSNVYFLRGVVTDMYSAPGNPREYFEKAVGLDANNPYPLNYLSMVDFEEGSYEKAAAEAKKAIELKPDYAPAYVNLAGALYQQGKQDETVDLLIECIKKCPSVPEKAYQSLLNVVSSDIPAMLGNQLIRMPAIVDEGQRSQIMKELSSNPKNYLEFTEYLLKNENTVDAGAFLSELAPPEGFADFHRYLCANLSFVAYDDSTFSETAEPLLESDWADYLRMFQVGVMYYQVGEPEKAIKAFEAGLRHLDPADTWYEMEFNSNLGASYLAVKDLEKAKSYMLKALKIVPDDVITLMNLGLVYFVLDDKEQSRRMFTEAAKHNPDPDQQDIIDSYLNEKLK